MVHFLRIARICIGQFLSEYKKIEYLAWNCDLATILNVLMEKRGFYNGGKSENLEIPFLAKTIYQYGSTVYQNSLNYNIFGGGYVF